MELDEKLCDEVKTVMVFINVGDRVSADGGCEATVTARTICGWLCLGSLVSCCMASYFL